MNNFNTAPKPKVSVFMMTYNHAPYIKQALESVLDQRTDFAVQIVIGEDKSTDGTREIVADFARRYPNQIHALLHEKNVGASQNQLLVLRACSGEYIAILEGDDYWTDPNKLQKQVDFLDTNSDYAISSHNVTVVSNEKPYATNGKPLYSEAPFDTLTLKELAKGNTLPTASCVYRNYFTAGPAPVGFPDWLGKVKVGDFCLHLLAARFGKIKYFQESMAAYRLHSGGIWTGQSILMRNSIFFDSVNYLKQEFTDEVRILLNEMQLRCLSEIAHLSVGVPGFTVQDFLMERQGEILSLQKEMYLPFMESYFKQVQEVHSAEYRYGKKILAPLRWITDKMRRT
ncbi:hypothetical protein GCM10028822_28650 [Hymenobacter terrigena]